MVLEESTAEQLCVVIHYFAHRHGELSANNGLFFPAMVHTLLLSL